MISFEKEKKEIEKWLQRSQNRVILFEEPTEKLNEYIRNGASPSNVSRLASGLGNVASWYCNEFLNGLANSRDCVQVGSAYLDCRWWHPRIIIEAIDHPEGRGRVFAKDLHLTFLLLLSFNRWEQAKWLGQRIYEGDTIERFNAPQPEYKFREVSEWETLGGDVKGFGAVVASIRRLIPGQREKEGSAGRLDDEPAFPHWEDKPLCGLVLRLWLIMTGKAEPSRVPEGLPSCGAYSGLFENWSDEAKLSQSIAEACDYHLSRTEENPAIDYDIAEFEARPYNVLPVEVLALRTIRKRLSLSTPWPEHELLSSPFARNLPETLPPSDSELIQRVYKAVQGVFPEIKQVTSMH